jgi:hypothetical protein
MSPERRQPDSPDWLDPEVISTQQERVDLIQLSERLVEERPLPAPTFRGALRRRLVAQPRGTTPARLGLAIGACGSSGLALLGAVALGVLGAGPFAA